jgi:hypothetical protein
MDANDLFFLFIFGSYFLLICSTGERVRFAPQSQVCLGRACKNQWNYDESSLWDGALHEKESGGILFVLCSQVMEATEQASRAFQRQMDRVCTLILFERRNTRSKELALNYEARRSDSFPTRLSYTK